MSLRCLVAGTGSIGRRHIGNIRGLRPDATFAFLRDGRREDALSHELDAAVLNTVDEAIHWAPDLAVVANPSDAHAAILVPLLEAGIATFIEKPIVIAASDVARLRRLSLTGPTQVGCVLRFLPSLRHLQAIVADGQLGRVVRAVLEVGQYLPDWRPTSDYRASYSASIERGGGVVLDLVHEIDLACWLFGEVVLLGAWGDRLSELEIESEDVATLVLRGGKGEQIAVQLDYVARAPIRRITIVGDHGTALWDLAARQLIVTNADGAMTVDRDGFNVGSAYVEAMRELIAAKDEGKKTSLPLAEGLRATAIAIDANRLIRGEATLC